MARSYSLSLRGRCRSTPLHAYSATGSTAPMPCFSTGAAPRACTRPRSPALATSCRSARCWRYSENSWRQSAVTGSGAHRLDDRARASGSGGAQQGTADTRSVRLRDYAARHDTSPNTPPHDHPSVAGENAAADLVADLLCTRVGAPSLTRFVAATPAS